MAEFYTVVTETGLEQLQDCIAGDKNFEPAYIAVGDSNGSYYEPEKTQSSLKNIKYSGEIYAQGKKGNYLYFDMQIPPSIGDFTIREAGLFDADDNLLAVAKYPETLKQAAEGTSDKSIIIELQILLSDNAINQINIDESGNLITVQKLSEYQILTEKNEAGGYTGLDDNGQINVVHIPFHYKEFCVNSGNVDNEGNPSFLSLSQSGILETNGTFEITTAKGKTYIITDALTKDISQLTEGEYNIFINPVSKVLSVKKNKIYIGGIFPEGAVAGDYLLNTSKVPYDLEEKTSSGTSSGLNEVLAGTLTISASGGGNFV